MCGKDVESITVTAIAIKKTTLTDKVNGQKENSEKTAKHNAKFRENERNRERARERERVNRGDI